MIAACEYASPTACSHSSGLVHPGRSTTCWYRGVFGVAPQQSSGRTARYGDLHARVGSVAEHAERLTVPRRDLAEGEHAGRGRAVAGPAVDQRAGPVASEQRRLRAASTTPIPAVRPDGDLDRAGDVAEVAGRHHHELTDVRVARRQ